MYMDYFERVEIVFENKHTGISEACVPGAGPEPLRRKQEVGGEIQEPRLSIVTAQ